MSLIQDAVHEWLTENGFYKDDGHYYHSDIATVPTYLNFNVRISMDCVWVYLGYMSTMCMNESLFFNDLIHNMTPLQDLIRDAMKNNRVRMLSDALFCLRQHGLDLERSFERTKLFNVVRTADNINLSTPVQVEFKHVRRKIQATIYVNKKIISRVKLDDPEVFVSEIKKKCK